MKRLDFCSSKSTELPLTNGKLYRSANNCSKDMFRGPILRLLFSLAIKLRFNWLVDFILCDHDMINKIKCHRKENSEPDIEIPLGLPKFSSMTG